MTAPPVAPARTGPIATINPVAKLAAALLIAVPLVLTIDAVSAATALTLELVLFALSGLRWREFWIRTLPVWVAAPLTAITIALYGAPSGAIYFEWLFVRVSDGSLELALATFFRVEACDSHGGPRVRRAHRRRGRVARAAHLGAAVALGYPRMGAAGSGRRDLGHRGLDRRGDGQLELHPRPRVTPRDPT